MKMILCFVALACLLALAVGSMGGPHDGSGKDQKNSGLSAGVRAVLRLEGRAQIKQLAAMAQDYADLEAELSQQFRNVTSVEQKCALAFLMGWYRSSVCVPDLAPNVTLKYESTEPDRKLPLWGAYPVVDALTRIGKPAVGPMLRNIGTGKDKEFRRLSTDVILNVEGPGVSRFMLESELKETKDETGRKRFQEALDYLGKGKS